MGCAIFAIVGAALLWAVAKVFEKFSGGKPTKAALCLACALLCSSQALAGGPPDVSFGWPSSDHFPRQIEVVEWFVAAGVALLFLFIAIWIGFVMFRRLWTRARGSV